MPKHSSSKIASVLVVDEDVVLQELVTALFQKAGLRVLTASSGEAALAMLRNKGADIDWLFTDIGLPGWVDGWTVADEYRLSYPFRPIIYSSTSASREGRVVQGSIFVGKPFQPIEILRVAKMMQLATVTFPGDTISSAAA